MRYIQPLFEYRFLLEAAANGKTLNEHSSLRIRVDGLLGSTLYHHPHPIG